MKIKDLSIALLSAVTAAASIRKNDSQREYKPRQLPRRVIVTDNTPMPKIYTLSVNPVGNSAYVPPRKETPQDL